MESLTRMTTQRLGPSIQLLMNLPLLHLLIPRTVLRSREDAFVVLITENALDIQVQTPHQSRQQSLHHASIL